MEQVFFMTDSSPRERKTTLFKANIWSIGFMAIFLAIYGGLFWLFHGDEGSLGNWEQEGSNNGVSSDTLGIVGFFVLFIGGVVLHELLHAVTFAWYSQNGWRSIQFGVIWQHMAPYCHCKEALPVRHYLKGILMPGLVLGLLPALIGIMIGSFPWLIFGWLFSVVAAGDLIMARMLLQENPDDLALDMDDAPGFWVYEQSES